MTSGFRWKLPKHYLLPVLLAGAAGVFCATGQAADEPLQTAPPFPTHLIDAAKDQAPAGKFPERTVEVDSETFDSSDPIDTPSEPASWIANLGDKVGHVQPVDGESQLLFEKPIGWKATRTAAPSESDSGFDSDVSAVVPAQATTNLNELNAQIELLQSDDSQPSNIAEVAGWRDGQPALIPAPEPLAEQAPEPLPVVPPEATQPPPLLLEPSLTPVPQKAIPFPAAEPMFESSLGIVPGAPCETCLEAAAGGFCPDCDGQHGHDGGMFEPEAGGRLSRFCDPCSPWYKLFRPLCSYPTSDTGIGHERVMFAPFLLQVPQPQNFNGLRVDSAQGLRTPDRGELFWAQQGVSPPAPETVVDYQDVVLTLSSGSDVFSTTTELPIRYINPTFNDNTTGIGDMSIATRKVMVDGDNWKLTQYFRTVLPTGSKTRGLGTGHISLEPGFLAHLRWTDDTYLFADIRYLIAVGGNSPFAGQSLTYGFGSSTILYETDAFAILPTVEMLGWSVTGGSETLPSGLVVSAAGSHSALVSSGVRFVLGPAGDLGLCEVGLNVSAAVNERALYENQTRLELRFIY